MLRTLSIIVGLILLIFGILGFMPDFSSNGSLFGIFSINPLHNAIPLVAGFIAILCGLSSIIAAKVFFILFGILFIALGIYGFYVGDQQLFNLIANNSADSWLHVILGAILFLIGVSRRA